MATRSGTEVYLIGTVLFGLIGFGIALKVWTLLSL